MTLGRVVLAIAWSAVFVFAVDTLFWPMGFDQAHFSYLGWAVREGSVLYRDVYAIKGPAAPLTYALAQVLFGDNTWGFRLVDLCVLEAGVAGLYMLSRPTGVWAAHHACLMFTLMYLGQGYWFTAQPDEWAILLLVLGMAWVSRSRDDARAASAMGFAGVLVGIAAAYKPPFALFVLPLAMLAPRRAGVAPWREWGWLLAGAALTGGAFLLFLALQGGLGAMLEAQLEFNLSVHAGVHQISARDRLAQVAATLAHPMLILQLPLVALGVSRWRKNDPALLKAVGAFAGVGVLLLVLQNKYYVYHWMPLSVPLALLAGVGLEHLAGYTALRFITAGSVLPRLVPALYSGVVLALIAPPTNLSGVMTYVFSRFSYQEYASQPAFFPGTPYSPLEDASVAEHVARSTKPGETILVWGMTPGVHFLSRRGSATRFDAPYPLIAGEGGALRERYRKEALDDLRRNRPRLVIVVDGDVNNLYGETSLRQLSRFPELVRWLEQTYVYDRQIGFSVVWRRRDAKPAPS